MGIRTTPKIKIMKKNVTGNQPGIVSTVDAIRTAAAAALPPDTDFWKTVTKTRIPKDLKNMTLVPVDEVFASVIPAFRQKQQNNVPLRNTDHYVYSSPSSDGRAIFRTLHYNIRHYNGSKSANRFPVQLKFSKDGKNCKIKIEAEEYAGSNPATGHKISLYEEGILTARVFFFRFGDMRTDVLDEHGKEMMTRDGLETMDKFLRFYYANAEKSVGKTKINWLKI